MVFGEKLEKPTFEPLILGWREWLAIPGLSIPAIKAKIDTGAKTSALHAINIEAYKKGGLDYVRFVVQPLQYTDDVLINCDCQLIDERTVTDSGGHQEERYVIETQLILGQSENTIEMTLTDRRCMKFRMLLGRDAMQDPIMVRPAASYHLGRLHHRSIYNT